MGELCLVVKFGPKRTGNNKKRAGKMKKDILKSIKNEKNYKKREGYTELKLLKFYI